MFHDLHRHFIIVLNHKLGKQAKVSPTNGEHETLCDECEQGASKRRWKEISERVQGQTVDRAGVKRKLNGRSDFLFYLYARCVCKTEGSYGKVLIETELQISCTQLMDIIEGDVPEDSYSKHKAIITNEYLREESQQWIRSALHQSRAWTEKGLPESELDVFSFWKVVCLHTFIDCFHKDFGESSSPFGSVPCPTWAIFHYLLVMIVTLSCTNILSKSMVNWMAHNKVLGQLNKLLVSHFKKIPVEYQKQICEIYAKLSNAVIEGEFSGELNQSARQFLDGIHQSEPKLALEYRVQASEKNGIDLHRVSKEEIERLEQQAQFFHSKFLRTRIIPANVKKYFDCLIYASCGQRSCTICSAHVVHPSFQRLSKIAMESLFSQPTREKFIAFHKCTTLLARIFQIELSIQESRSSSNCSSLDKQWQRQPIIVDTAGERTSLEAWNSTDDDFKLKIHLYVNCMQLRLHIKTIAPQSAPFIIVYTRPVSAVQKSATLVHLSENMLRKVQNELENKLGLKIKDSCQKRSSEEKFNDKKKCSELDLEKGSGLELSNPSQERSEKEGKVEFSAGGAGISTRPGSERMFPKVVTELRQKYDISRGLIAIEKGAISQQEAEQLKAFFNEKEYLNDILVMRMLELNLVVLGFCKIKNSPGLYFEKTTENGKKHVLIFDSQFLPRFDTGGFSSIVRWYRRLKPFFNRTHPVDLLFPVNIKELEHWIGIYVEIYVYLVLIHVFDPFGLPHPEIVAKVNSYLIHEFESEGHEGMLPKITVIVHEKVQLDGWNCSILTAFELAYHAASVTFDFPTDKNACDEMFPIIRKDYAGAFADMLLDSSEDRRDIFRLICASCSGQIQNDAEKITYYDCEHTFHVECVDVVSAPCQQCNFVYRLSETLDADSEATHRFICHTSIIEDLLPVDMCAPVDGLDGIVLKNPSVFCYAIAAWTLLAHDKIVYGLIGSDCSHRSFIKCNSLSQDFMGQAELFINHIRTGSEFEDASGFLEKSIVLSGLDKKRQQCCDEFLVLLFAVMSCACMSSLSTVLQVDRTLFSGSKSNTALARATGFFTKCKFQCPMCECIDYGPADFHQILYLELHSESRDVAVEIQKYFGQEDIERRCTNEFCQHNVSTKTVEFASNLRSLTICLKAVQSSFSQSASESETHCHSWGCHVEHRGLGAITIPPILHFGFEATVQTLQLNSMITWIGDPKSDGSHGHYLTLVDYNPAEGTFTKKDDQCKIVEKISMDAWSRDRKTFGFPVMLNYNLNCTEDKRIQDYSNLSDDHQQIMKFMLNETSCNEQWTDFGSSIRARLTRSKIPLKYEELQSFMPLTTLHEDTNFISCNKKLSSMALLNTICVLSSYGIQLKKETISSDLGFSIKKVEVSKNLEETLLHLSAYSEKTGNKKFCPVLEQIKFAFCLSAAGSSQLPVQVTQSPNAHTISGPTGNTSEAFRTEEWGTITRLSNYAQQAFADFWLEGENLCDEQTQDHTTDPWTSCGWKPSL